MIPGQRHACAQAHWARGCTHACMHARTQARGGPKRTEGTEGRAGTAEGRTCASLAHAVVLERREELGGVGSQAEAVRPALGGIPAALSPEGAGSPPCEVTGRGRVALGRQEA